MIIKIAVAAAILAAGLVTFVATRPGAFRVERSGVVGAPPAVAFALVNDLRQWERWSPWEKQDPQMVKHFDGPDAGRGASYEWTGDKAGAGRMTILESRPDEQVELRLEFTRPLTATNLVTFTFEPVPEGTRVTWRMEGKNGFVGKAFGLFVDMDEMCGRDFVAGLASLDAEARADLRRPSAALVR